MVNSKKEENSQKKKTGSNKSSKKNENWTFTINKDAFRKTIIGVILAILIVAGLIIFTGENSEIENSDNDVATVNGEAISSEELNTTREYLLQQGQQVSEKEALEQLIDQKLILQEAQKEGYTVSTEEAESTIEEQLSQQGSTLEDYKQQLEQQGMSYKKELKKYQENRIIQNYLAFKFQDVNFNVTEQEIEEYYNKSIQGSEQVPSYEEVKSQIAQGLQQQKQNEAINSLIEELRNKAEIDYLKEFETSSEDTNFPVQIQQ